MFNRRTRGAISIFLVIIFLVTYVFAGLLVDGGRVKLAAAMAEIGLDNAAASALTYYDNLLYELYGLFSLEEPDLEEVKSTMETYLSKTLALTSKDNTQMAEFLNDVIFTSIDAPDYFDGYEFNIDKLEVGSNINLSQTDVVESQIIEHMKYRAPMHLTDDIGEFLKDLEMILSMKDRFAAIKDKNKITKEYNKPANGGESLFDRTAELLEDINKLKSSIGRYANDPINLKLASGRVSGKDTWTYVKDYDQRMYDIYNMTLEEGQTEEERVEEINRKINEEKEDFLKSLETIVENGENVYKDAASIKERIKKLNDDYKNYIEELIRVRDQHKDSEHYKTVFNPEIELATSNAGELLKNMDIILRTMLYANVSNYKAKIHSIEYAASAIIGRIETGNPGQSAISLEDELKNNVSLFHDGYNYFEDINEKLNNLADVYNLYKEVEMQQIEVKEIEKSEDDKSKLEVSKDGGIKDIKQADIKDAVEAPDPSDSDDITISDEMDFDDTDSIINKGFELFERLANKIVEDTRDNLYINEYILRNFKNHVHHYNMVNKPVTEKPDRVFAEHLLKEPYNSVSYTVAEIEYILSGKLNASASIFNVKAKIMGIRTLANIAAMFTDSAKIRQASIMASFSGPYAPLVSILILTAWAIAESAIDVVNIIKGEEVYFFKQGQWEIGIKNAAEEVIERLADKAKEEVKEYINGKIKIDKFLDSAERGVNTAIYDLYNSNVPSKEEAKRIMDELEKDMKSQSPDPELDICIEKITDELNDAINKPINMAEELRDELVAKIGEGFALIRKEKNEFFDESFDKVADAAIDALYGFFPYGEVKSTGVNDGVQFGYGDYLRFFLLLMPNKTKVERVQGIIQVNMGKQREGFKMNMAYVNIWAEMDCSVKYLFISAAFVPEEIKREGRHAFRIISNRAY